MKFPDLLLLDGLAQKVKLVTIKDCGITSFPQPLSMYECLKKLDLSSNDFSAFIIEEPMESLELLTVSNCPRLDTIALFVPLRKLREVNLSRCALSRLNLAVPSLRKLDLSYNNITLNEEDDDFVDFFQGRV